MVKADLRLSQGIDSGACECFFLSKRQARLRDKQTASQVLFLGCFWKTHEETPKKRLEKKHEKADSEPPTRLVHQSGGWM